MKAVVLAAGKGVRMQPLTSTRPKHLIHIGGKPILEHVISSIKAARINNILIVVNYMQEKIKRHFGDGSKHEVKIEYIYQKKMLGTADAVGTVEPHVDKDFLLVYGDLLFDSDVIKKVVQMHEQKKPTVTMTVVPVKHPEHYGIVELDGDRVVSILEKPTIKKTQTKLANAGIYVFSTEIFDKIKQTRPSTRGELEITDSITSLIKEKHRILATQISSEKWIDVGKPWDLLEANRWVLQRIEPKIYGQIENGVRLLGAVAVAKGARIRSGAYIEGPVFIDEQSDIGPNCFIRPHTSIGKKVRIGNACEIKNSIIMDNTRIGHLSYVGDSVLGEGCNLGAGTKVANFRLDGKTIKMMVKDEVVDSGRIKLGVILGDRVKTGINASLMPGVKVGHNSWIGPGVVLYRDVQPNTILLLKQNLERRETAEKK